ncbi:MAG: hypothetical protein KDA60_21535, partial [Planctomycetales bacterium]|nr:hypothetical protein [Planctomycetales bacterium]
ELLRQANGWDFPTTLARLAGFLGVLGANGSTGHIADMMTAVANAKRMPIESMRVYGAVPAKRGKLDVVRFPVWNERGAQHSYFDLTTTGKGWFKKAESKSEKTSGLFFPNRLPQPGETWLLVEGPKDACALHGIGYINTCGCDTDRLAQRYVRLFRDVIVVIVPDRTADAEAKAETSAARLYGVAASVRIATLPLPIAISSDQPNDARDVLRLPAGERLLRAAVEDARSWDPPRPDPEIPSIATAEGQTDVANGRRLVRMHGMNLRYVGPWEKWLYYNGATWVLDNMQRVEQWAKGLVPEVFTDIGKCGAVHGGMVNFAKKTASMSGLSNAIRAARSELAIHHESLNREPYLLNVRNGTLNLRTLELRSHRREDLLTQLAPVDFDPDADCRLWLEFLRQITDGNDDLIAYLRRLVGYSLTGVVSEHLVAICYGAGANGKSVFLNCVMSMMGPDYSLQCPPNMLMIRKKEPHPTELADLFGRRLAAAVETEFGSRLSESLVKTLTGGDRIRARRCFEDHWEFSPTHKLWMATNHRPVIRGTDEGIWRRVKLIPFTVTIPPDRQDRNLLQKLQSELSGILNWALLGCQEWQHDGLGEPSLVSDATTAFRAESNVISLFLDDCCDFAPDSRVGAAELFRAYKDWGGRMSQTAFGAELAMKYEKRKSHGCNVYVGLALKPSMNGHVGEG